MTGNRQPAATGKRTDFDFLSDKIDAIHDRMIERIAALEKRVEELADRFTVCLWCNGTGKRDGTICDACKGSTFPAITPAAQPERAPTIDDGGTLSISSVQELVEAMRRVKEREKELIDRLTSCPERGERIELHQRIGAQTGVPVGEWRACLVGVDGPHPLGERYEHRFATFDAAPQAEDPFEKIKPTAETLNEMVGSPTRDDATPQDECGYVYNYGPGNRCQCPYTKEEHRGENHRFEPKPAAPPTEEPRRWTLHAPEPDGTHFLSECGGSDVGNSEPWNCSGRPKGYHVTVIEESAVAAKMARLREIESALVEWLDDEGNRTGLNSCDTLMLYAEEVKRALLGEPEAKP